MIIAIYTRQLPKIAVNGYQYDTIRYFIQLAEKQPAHQFIIIGEKKHARADGTVKNIQWVILPEIKSLLRWKLFQKFQLPAILKKNNIDLLINTNSLCCETAIPQILYNPDLFDLIEAGMMPQNHKQFLQKQLPVSFIKAKGIFTNTQVSKNKIAADYKIATDKITVVPDGAAERIPEPDYNAKVQVRELYAQGKEYFLYVGYTGEQSNLIHLLKAFSIFKKRQKSNMQLLIVAEDAATENHFTDNLKTYKFKSDVNVISDAKPDAVSNIRAAAYAFIAPALHDTHLIEAINAVSNKVPVVVDSRAEVQELFGNAALYADMGKFEDIAEKMMQLFKDEQLRNKCIDIGLEQIKQHDNKNAVDLLWQSIIRIFNETGTKKLS
mgnify:CR=1 FL=1